MNRATANRLFPWLLILLILAGGFFGLAPLLLPGPFASVFGFRGVDTFLYRIAGSASFGYAAGLAVGYRSSWTALRFPIAATAVFNLGSLVACVLAIAAGGAQAVVYVILIASLVFAPACLYYYFRPPDRPAEPAANEHLLAQWVVGLFVIGVLAALFFGIATLAFGGSFGRALGAPGLDDFVYRQAGAATLGAGIGGVLVVMDRRWSEARLPAISALTFNGLSVVAALIEIVNGTAQPIAYVILAAAGLVTVGSALALYRGGR